MWNKYHVPPDSITVLYDESYYQNPDWNSCNLPALVEGLQKARIYVVSTEGGDTDHNVEVERMSVWGDPFLRCLGLADLYGLRLVEDIWYYEGEVCPQSQEGSAIFLTLSGIQKIAANATPGFIMFDMYCYSADTASAWGVGAGDWGSPSMLGCSGETYPIYNAADLFTAVAVFDCSIASLPPYPIYDNTIGDVISADPGGVVLGWSGNRVHPGWSCWNPVGSWFHASACDGQVRMAYVGEDLGSVYHVLADGDTAATFPGRGTDGSDRLRCYSAAVSPGAECFRCVELDDSGFPTSSMDFTWSEEGEEWSLLQPLDDLTMAEVDSFLGPPPPADPWGPEAPYWDWIAQRDTWLSGQSVEWVDWGSYRQLLIGQPEDCALCGDVVVYQLSGTPFNLETVSFQIADDFPAKRVVLIEGQSDDPLLARAVLATVASNNAQYGGGQYPVDPGPTMILVGRGAGLGVSPMSYPDNAAGSCTGTCKTYNLIGDIYGADGIPDCPVQLIPVRTDQELTKVCFVASEWNNGLHVNEGRRGLFLLWDWTNASPNLGMTPVTTRIRNAYHYQSSDPGVLLARSAYPVGCVDTLLMTAVAEAFDSGPRDVWSIGYSGHRDGIIIPWLSYGWFHAGLHLTRNQVVMVFAPTCGSAALGNVMGNSVNRSLLVLAEPDDTRAAGFFGQLNGTHEVEHADFAWVFRNELGNAPQGATFDLVTHNAITAMAEQNPHYALGVLWLGSLTKVRGDFPTSTSVPEHVTQGRPQLWASQAENATNFHFTLAEDSHISLSVFEVQGRLVTRLREGWHAPGRYTYSWFRKDPSGCPVEAGVYFGRLQIGRSPGKVITTQLTVSK